MSAMVDGDRVVSSLLTEDEWAALKKDVRERRRAIQMPCGWPGQAKTSKLGTAHFAHKPGGDGCTAGESAEHLLAKAVIVNAILAAGWQAEPEARGEGWVADVMATRDGVRAAFEVQWTNQSLEEYRRRQQRYREAGIESIAWFARHTEHLPPADKSLPVFPLAVTADGVAAVQIEGRTLALSGVVERLLTRRLRHRDYYADQQPADAHVAGIAMDCYRCKERFGVWYVTAIKVRGRCGGEGTRGRSVPMFPEKRPETEPGVREAGQRLAQVLGVRPATLDRRYTVHSGTKYMAFTCPYCDAVCGEMFVLRDFAEGSEHQTEAKLPATVVHHPHWCLAEDEGTCVEPPASIIEGLYEPEEEGDGLGGTPGYSMTLVGEPGGITAREFAHRMVRGLRYGQP